jgi:hypothetical protein
LGDEGSDAVGERAQQLVMLETTSDVRLLEGVWLRAKR